jgi:cobalt-zinc-cadmium efflux system membrane fusion protein
MKKNIVPLFTLPRRIMAGALLGAAVLLGSLQIARAHEGHDHGAPTAAPLPTPLAGPKFVTVSEDFELVGVLSRDALTVYLDDTRTNRPIDGATLEIAAEGLSGKAAREAPGTYRLALKSPLPAGSYALTLSVDAAQGSDLLTAKLDVAKPAVAAGVVTSSPLAWKALTGSALLLVVLATAFLLLKRQRASRRRTGI